MRWFVRILVLSCFLFVGCSAGNGPTAACKHVTEGTDCGCTTDADCGDDMMCSYGRCYLPGCHYDCICGPLDCWEADEYGYSCDDCSQADVWAPAPDSESSSDTTSD